MTRTVDALVVGAGPAGISAATVLRELGMDVMVVDEQPAPGGQIWRAIETVATTPAGKLLGDEYLAGSDLARRFRACGAEYRPQTQVWQIEPGWQIFMSCTGKAETLRARQVLLATGAQERPAPFPGWTLPGVLTVGAAQILLKTSQQVPADPVWVVGSGPLPLLYMNQLLRAGGKIAGWLDTSPVDGWRRALPHLATAVRRRGDLSKGMGWLWNLRRAGVRRIRNVDSVRALGTDHVEHIEYTLRDGRRERVPARVVLVHEGVIPAIHMTSALGCAHHWSEAQACWVPDVDSWSQTSQAGIYVAGDGAGIGGAMAACVGGEVAAVGMALQAGRLSAQQARDRAQPLRARLADELRIRPLLDAMYPPRPGISNPPDDTVVCRCEELTAGDIRKAASVGRPGPNQIKSITRAGMGPCQGRQCGYTIAHILANAQGRPAAQVGFYRIRPPLKPLTLGELASLDTEDQET